MRKTSCRNRTKSSLVNRHLFCFGDIHLNLGCEKSQKEKQEILKKPPQKKTKKKIKSEVDKDETESLLKENDEAELKKNGWRICKTKWVASKTG